MLGARYKIIGDAASLAILMVCSSLLVLVRTQNDSITDPLEVKALRGILERLNDPYERLINWNHGDPCTSNWTGVLCSNTTMDDSYLHIQELQLLNMNLSGTLSPQLGLLPHLRILDFMWNNISGSIPKEIGNLTALELLLLNGNKLTGPLPEELGYIPYLDRIQIDQNQISGSIPKSFANLNKTKHFHMNNNSLSGQIPPELSRLPSLVHLLLDNNNLSGYLPPELSGLPSLLILQLDNNNFDGTVIPPSYSNMSKLLKLSLRNCSLQGPIPDLSRIPNLGYLDISWNKLNGTIPPFQLPNNITTIDLSYNHISGIIPDIFSGLHDLQILSLANNSLAGSAPSIIWRNKTLNGTERMILDFRNNNLSNISGSSDLPPNVSLWLQGNPLCSMNNLIQFCGAQNDDRDKWQVDGVGRFFYGEMALATNNFSNSAQVGQGDYGKVYKGLLADGTIVAIKRAQEGSLQGEKEFLTEIQLLSRVHHRNLVSLIGYCDEEGEQMLIYEFMSNGTLRDHLSARCKEPLSFTMRLRIAIGSAKGVLYLHTEADPPIFHRDIKASNILLDSKFTAKVADFGLSRLAPVPDTEGALPAHVSTVVKGTPGYLDPEYFLTHKLTDKSDVYSLGVVFLELLTGMQPISHGKNIVGEVNAAYQSGMIFSVIDGRMGSYPSECVEKFLTLALKCCRDETDSRPSVADIARELESIWLMTPESHASKTELAAVQGTKVEATTPPPSSMSMIKDPHVSADVSGSDLVSGIIPTITPR